MTWGPVAVGFRTQRGVPRHAFSHLTWGPVLVPTWGTKEISLRVEPAAAPSPLADHSFENGPVMRLLPFRPRI